MKLASCRARPLILPRMNEAQTKGHLEGRGESLPHPAEGSWLSVCP